MIVTRTACRDASAQAEPLSPPSKNPQHGGLLDLRRMRPGHERQPRRNTARTDREPGAGAGLRRRGRDHGLGERTQTHVVSLGRLSEKVERDPPGRQPVAALEYTLGPRDEWQRPQPAGEVAHAPAQFLELDLIGVHKADQQFGCRLLPDSNLVPHRQPFPVVTHPHPPGQTSTVG